MNYRGNVKLMNKSKVVHDFVYDNREARSLIIDRWERLYKEDFEKYVLIIAPEVIDDSFMWKPNKLLKPILHEKIVRPPAVYDNKKSLYA